MTDNANPMTVEDFDRMEAALPAESQPDPIELGTPCLISAGLRQAADIIERYERAGISIAVPSFDIWAHTKEDFAKRSRMLGRFTKVVNDSYFICRREFDGGVKIEVNIGRANLCQRKQVGVRKIAAVSYPEREEPIYEWDCTPSVLTPIAVAAPPAPAPEPEAIATPVAAIAGGSDDHISF